MVRYLDLSQPLSPTTPRSTDHPEVRFPVVRHYSTNGVKTRTIEASLHSGTHLDTANFISPDGETVDQVDVNRLAGEAFFIDCRLDKWEPITADFLDKMASDLRDRIPVLCTGWHHYRNDETKYLLMAPGLDKSGIDWMAKKHPKCFCVDSPSAEHIFMRAGQWRILRPDLFDKAPVDPVRYPTNYGHKTLLPLGIIMVEGLGGMIDELIGEVAKIFCFPAKYEGTEAAPVRVVAELPD